jgi:ribose 5-phosphate isomerase RpiB
MPKHEISTSVFPSKESTLFPDSHLKFVSIIKSITRRYSTDSVTSRWLSYMRSKVFAACLVEIFICFLVDIRPISTCLGYFLSKLSRVKGARAGLVHQNHSASAFLKLRQLSMPSESTRGRSQGRARLQAWINAKFTENFEYSLKFVEIFDILIIQSRLSWRGVSLRDNLSLDSTSIDLTRLIKTLNMSVNSKT